MGGVPDLPALFEYPKHKGNPLQFIAQFNLSDFTKRWYGSQSS